MSVKELREKFFDFFRKRRHAIIPSAPLIPENDPTVLFTTAGMHPLVPFLLGEKHPAGKRLVNIQKCLRTDDIEKVGDESHLTFFEMLGYWSLGDYFKETSIDYTFDFFTQVLKIPKERLVVTVFGGDEEIEADFVSYNYWKEKIGIPVEKIFLLGKEHNWWGLATGPCGPCTEVFYDTGKEKCHQDCSPACSCGKYIEIGNNVFMEYNKTAEGKLIPLRQKNVDVGLGLERILAVINHKNSVFETEVFERIIQIIKGIANFWEEVDDSFDSLYNPSFLTQQKIEKLKKKSEKERAIRIIADHLKAAVFVLAEGLEPSNVERGYVLRRLIRRAIRYAHLIGIEKIFAFQLVKPVLEIYHDYYPELLKNKDFIEEQLIKEEERFLKTLEKGLKKIRNLTRYFSGNLASFNLTAEQLFDLYQSEGFPLEISLEEIERIREENNGQSLSLKEKETIQREFNNLMEKHKELSRTAAAGFFKGGLVDQSEIVVKYHTATHLLHQALREILGEEVAQKGSNITPERLRFDFSYSKKPSADQLKKVEEIVNQKIQEALPVIMKEMTLKEARALGAIGLFPEKYGEKVKVYFIGEPERAYSKEICGGPHVKNTKELGKFRIIKEEAVSGGVRRIKAVLE